MAACKELTDDILSCPICFLVYDRPTSLACGHTMCFECLVSSAENNNQTRLKRAIPCPFCRQWMTVPGVDRGQVRDWVSKVKPNFLIQDIINAVNDVEENCQICQASGQTVKGHSYCKSCKQTVCKQCRSVHNKKHHMVIMDPAKDDVDDACTEHRNQILELYCKDCKKPVCPMCGALDHRKCSQLVKLSEVTAPMKSTLQYEKGRLLVSLKQLNIATATKERKYDELLNLVAKNRGLIQARGNQLRNIITVKEKALLKKLQEFELNAGGETQTFLDKARQVKEITTITADTLQSQIDGAGDFEIVNNFQNLKEFSGTMASNVASLFTGGGVQYNIRFDSYPKDQTVLQKLNFFSLTSIRVNPKPSLKKTYRHSEWADGIIDLDIVVVNGRDVVVVSIYDGYYSLHSAYLNSEAEVVGHLTPPGNRPWSVSRCIPNKVMICNSENNSHDHYIEIINVDPQLSVQRKIKTKKVYVSLTALTASTIACAAEEPASVDIFDINREVVLKTLDNRSFRREIFSSPFFLSSYQNNILVSDAGSKTVFCISKDGNLNFTYNNLQCPHGIGVRPDGAVFVADHHKNVVIQLSAFGSFVQEEASAPMIQNPHGLCFDSDGNMLVSQDNTVLRFGWS